MTNLLTFISILILCNMVFLGIKYYQFKKDKEKQK